MTWQEAWFVLLGLMFIGYLLSEGRSIGIGLVLHLLGKDRGDRDEVVSAVGPYFLGNEVWIVSVVGLLIGGFPIFEGTLLSGLFPLFGTFVVGMVLRGAAFHFRRRVPSLRWRRGWEIVITTASLMLALSLGAIGAALFHRLPLRADGVLPLTAGVLFTPLALFGALTSVLVFALFGAAFAATRILGPVADRAILLTSKLTRVALTGVLVSFGVGLLSDDVRASIQQPGVVYAMVGAAVVALVVCDWFAMRGAARPAFLLSGAVLVAAALAVGVGRFPYLLVSRFGDAAGMTVTEGGADPAILAPLFWVVMILIPVLLLSQLWAWRLYRAADTADTRAYF